MRRWLLPALALMLAACSGAPKKATPPATQHSPATQSDATAMRSPYAPAQEDPSKRGNYTRGGLYAPEIQDSAPDELPDVARIPEPVVRDEPRSRYGNRPSYSVLGKSYRVMDSAKDYVERGIASYYGKKFHGRRTSSMEVYDMYAFSAAHKTLPLPSYARVTNLGNGKSVVVRVNDRGPFHAGRIIDLSYAAAVKLGVHRSGTAQVEVRGLSPGENARQPDEAVAMVPAASTVPTAPAPIDVLPVGVRIATGKPQPMQPSGIDRLVAVLPIASVQAGERVASVTMPDTAPPAAERTSALPDADTLDWRFDMRQDGRTMTADEFDAWLRSRRARVATGKPGTPDPRMASPATRSARTAVPAAATARKAPATPAATSKPASTHASSGDSVVLQVAAFAARDNAERALAVLHDAGIGHARLYDAQANGRQLWRLRVGPVDPAATAELGARIQGLGFGQPQRVRE